MQKVLLGQETAVTQLAPSKPAGKDHDVPL
jgi:hypothetical protein